jgi:hypothetical protein
MDKYENISQGPSNENWEASIENFTRQPSIWDKEYSGTSEIITSTRNLMEKQEKYYIGEEKSVNARKQLLNEEYTNLYKKLNLPYFHELKQTDRYVRIYENALSDSFCNHMIQLFEKNPNYHSMFPVTSTEMSLISNNNGNTDILKGVSPLKTTTDLYFNDFKQVLKKEHMYIFQQLSTYMLKYFQDMNLPSIDNEHLFGSHQSGYQMQKYTKNEGRFIFHDDSVSVYNPDEQKVGHRTVTFLFYLNDVEEGGETTFPEFQVKPKKGSLLLFPATWNYIHSANIPRSSDKYVITGWQYKFER